MADLNTPTAYQPPARRPIPGGFGTLQQVGDTALLGVDPNMLVTNRLNTLLRSDNPLLAGARGRAMNYAAAKGAGADSASYGWNAEQAMGDILTPLASQEAGVYTDTYTGNRDALNRTAENQLQARTSMNVANVGRASAMDRLREDARQFNQQQANRAQDRIWQMADAGTAAQASARSQFFGQLESAMFSDPAVWRDPQGVIGAFNQYGANFDALFQSLFPEYGEWQDAGAASGGPP